MRRTLLSLLFLSSVMLTSCATTAAQLGEAAGDSLSQRIYACNQGAATVAVIDGSTLEVVETVDLQKLGFSANAKPHDAVAEADGSHWYVSLIGENRVLRFNRRNELVGQAEMEVPGLLELHPTRDLLLVGRSMSAVNPPQSIGLIRRSDMTLQQEIDTFFERPHAIAITPDGRYAFAASLAENQILSLDLETGETELTMLDGSTHVFVNFAISPDGSTLLVTGQMSGKALIFDIGDPAAPVLTDTIDVNPQPWHPLYSADGKYVYFGNKEANSVTVLDMESRAVDAVIEGEGLSQPHGSALSEDGKWLFISSNNKDGHYRSDQASSAAEPPGTVTVINTETREIEKVIELGANTTGIGTRARW